MTNTKRIGARGYPIRVSESGQRDYIAEADAIVGRGRPWEQFTTAERKEALALAIQACKADGKWPEKQSKPGPDKLCAYGHQFVSGKSCRDCARIKDQIASRERSNKRRALAKGKQEAA